MMNKVKIIITLVLVVLAGCKPGEGMTGQFAKSFTDSLFSTSTAKKPEFSIGSPYTVMIDGKKTQVRGIDTCRDELTNTSFECIDLSKPFADVYLLLPSGAHKERWSFVKDEKGNFLSLRRPDGMMVVPATKQ